MSFRPGTLGSEDQALPCIGAGQVGDPGYLSAVAEPWRSQGCLYAGQVMFFALPSQLPKVSHPHQLLLGEERVDAGV